MTLMLLVVLTVKILLGHFTRGNCKKQTKKSLESKKWSKEKAINYMVNAKTTIIFLTIGLIQKMLLHKINYFPEPYILSKDKMTVFFDLYNYGKKIWLKSVDKSKFNMKT